MNINVNLTKETLESISSLITYATSRREWEDFIGQLSERLDEDGIEHDWEDWNVFDDIPKEFLEHSDHVYIDACRVNDELLRPMLQVQAS